MNIAKIGKIIAAKRRELGYTQEDLGRALGVTDKAVSKWERGISYPDVALLDRIATLLRIDVKVLLHGEISEATDSSLAAQKKEGSTPRSAARSDGTVQLDFGTHAAQRVSPRLFGNNLEHTRSCLHTGLSAQMLKNRKFAGKPSAVSGHAVGWYPIGEKTHFAFSEPYTRHDTEHYHMKRALEMNAQRIIGFADGQRCGIGQHELTVQAGRQYDFHIVAQTAGEIELTVALTDRGGKRVYAQQTVRICGAEWERYHAVLDCTADDGDADLRVTFCGKGCLDIGALSLMPTDHFRGMRRDVIEALKTLGVRVLRWPGGNFAGEYNWFDGLLPVDMRAPFASYLGLETQAHTMGFDYHEINTDDFIALCREIGAEPYLTINLTWNTAQENAAWVEYCNGDATTKYGKLRAERGHAEPYGVKLWTLGNEFGYGHMEGDNSPQGYCRLAQESGAKMLEVTEDLIFCSSGPHPDADWVKHAAKPLAPISSLVSLHYYAPSPSYVNEEEAEEEFLTCMGSVQTARNAVHRLRELLGESDIGISFDEWNTWYAWYRPSCVVDGLFTAAMLHMIIGEAAHYRIDVSCHFEAINEGLIEVSPHGAVLTAAGQAFAMMKHHIDGELCHASDAAVVTRREDVLTVTLLNTFYREERTFTLPAVGEVLGATLYRADELIPHTTFTPTELSVQVQEGRGAVTLPAHSMAMLQFRLPPEL